MLPPAREGARGGRAGLDVRMGAIRRQLRPRHRHDGPSGPPRPSRRFRRSSASSPTASRRAPRSCWASSERRPRGRQQLPTGSDALAERRQLQRLLEARHRGRSCCCSMGSTTQRPRAWCASIHRPTARTTTGTCSCPTYDPASCTRIGSRVRSIRRAACASIPPKFSWIPTAEASWFPEAYGRDAARGPGDNAGTAMKSVVVDVSAYDWEGDAPLPTVVTDDRVRDARGRLHPSLPGPSRSRCSPP